MLTRRASLNSLSALLDYGTKIVVSLLVTPIILTTLGASLFGIWEILQRLATYLSAADGRPTEALRLVVARHAEAEPAQLRRHVGAALVVWVLMLPLVILVAGLLVWLAPSLTHAPLVMHGAVRGTAALLMVAFLFTTLALVPEGVLRGTNQGYRRMGLQALLIVVGGALMAAAVWRGLGLMGLGGALIIREALTGLVFVALTKKFVPWFGASRPTPAERRQMLGTSAWLMFGDLMAKIIRGADVVILGAVLGPAAVTPYVLTAYAAQASDGVQGLALTGPMPGMGTLLGAGELGRVSRVRGELLRLNWLYVTVIGVGVLAGNRGFLALWVGPERYAGPLVDLLIVLIATAGALVRVDSFLMDSALLPQVRVRLQMIGAAVTLAFGVGLTLAWGLPGLCTGLLIGRVAQLAGFPAAVRSKLKLGPALHGLQGVWLGTVTAVLWAGAMLLSPQVPRQHWITWGISVAGAAALSFALACALGPAAVRASLAQRWQSVRGRG